MTIDLTVTPQPDSASVLLTATTDLATNEVVVLDLDADAIVAEGMPTWHGDFESIQQFGTVVAFYASSTYSTAVRTLTGLTVGKRYRLVLTVERTSLPTTFEVGDVVGDVPTGSGTWTVEVVFVATATSHDFTLNTVWNNKPFVGGLRLIDSPEAFTWSLTRSDDNGVRPVRLYEGQSLSDGTVVVTDTEPALTGQVLYTVTVNDETSSAMTTLAGLVTRSRIAPASMPAQGQWWDLAPGLTVGRSTTTTIAQVINRPDPLVTLGTQTLRAGTLRLFADDYAMGAALEAVFNRGDVVLLRQPAHAGLDMYMVGTSTSLELQPELTSPRRWVLSVDYTEVAAPTTALRGSIGWTIAASLERNATLAASRAEFATVLDLLIGPAS